MGKGTNFRTEKCIDKYISLNAVSNSSELSESPEETSTRKSQAPQKIDGRLQSIVERLFEKCFKERKFDQAIGIAIETRRLDYVERGIEQAGQPGKGKKKQDGKDERLELMEYVLDVAMNIVQDIALRNEVRWIATGIGWILTSD